MENNNSDKLTSFITGILVGGILGSTLTFLFTPVTGKRLRRNIAHKTEDLLEDATDVYESSKDRVRDTLKESKKKADEFISEGKKKVDTMIDEAKN